MLKMRKMISPNFNDRANGVKPSILILHYTGTLSAQEAEDYYMNVRRHKASGPISPHYMIDKDGTITQFVDEEKRAWHAGKSWWDGADDINSHSIGIELVNPGHERGYHPFPQAQMDALAELTKGILSRHKIPPHRILGHSDIAPTRKPDPGELMNWAWLALKGVGLWPTPAQKDYEQGDLLLKQKDGLRKAFTAYGYDPNLALNEITRAFQQHFQTELFATPERVSTPDRDTAARLHWLLNQKNAFKA